MHPADFPGTLISLILASCRDNILRSGMQAAGVEVYYTMKGKLFVSARVAIHLFSQLGLRKI